MARLPNVSAHDWSLLTGVVTGGLALLLVPAALLLSGRPRWHRPIARLAALDVLLGANGLPELLREAVAAATRRSRELGG